jgi:cytochrome c553
MRGFVAILMLACLTGTVEGADTSPPPWAFAVNPPGTQPAPDDGTLRRVPGSSVALTLTQIRDLFTVPDWHPDGHPPMPEVVRHGAKPDVFACGYCHLPNGLGRPENSSLAGRSPSYVVRQLYDMQHGVRNGPWAELMKAVVAQLSEEDMVSIAAYMASRAP